MEKNNNVLKVTNGICIRITDLLKNIDRTEPAERKYENKLEDGGSISIQLKLSGYERWVQMKHTDYNGDTTLDYFILLEAMKCNLPHGGERLYFTCPKSNRRCMDLYSFGNGMFTHREEQEGGRVFYESQLLSHSSRVIYSMTALEQKIPVLKEEIHKSHWKGFLTQKQQRVIGLQSKLEEKQLGYINAIELQGKKELKKMLAFA